MNIRAVVSLLTLLLVASALWSAENRATEEENRMLSIILKRTYDDGGYTVVKPETGLDYVDGGNARQRRKRKSNIAEFLKTHGIVAPKLIDRLYDRNIVSVRLTLESSPEDGYMIDYDGKYWRYFSKDGGGWREWHKENPKAHGYTTVSLPVYDERSRLALVYMETQYDWLAGDGFIILYRYENGELKMIGKMFLWIS